MKMKKLMAIGFAVLALMGARAENVAYLSETGNDGTAALNDEGHPYGTLQAAVEALRETGGTVSVARGTYELVPSEAAASLNSCFVLDCAVRIVGATGDPKDVTFKRSSSVVSARVFRLSHADAAVQAVTITGGYFKNIAANGGNVLIDQVGGTVENCIISNGRGSDSSGESYGGGNIYLAGGRCSGCVISGGTFGNIRPYGTNVRAAGTALVENCLITGGRDVYHTGNYSGGAVCLDDSARLINCTVVNNHNYRLGGVVVFGDSAKVVNCVIYGNTVDNEMDDGDNSRDTYDNRICNGRLGVFQSCATDVNVKTYGQLNETCFSVDETDFVDVANGDWHLADLSDCRDCGADYAAAGGISETDLDGEQRVQGIIDVGCYEHEGEFFIRANASSYTGILDESDTITYTVESYCADQDVSYAWDFGDGTTVTTSETTVDHQYRTAGSYTVSVVATSGEETATLVLPQPVVISGFKCTFSVSAKRGIVNVPFVFKMTDSTAEGGIRLTWDFGDGKTLVTTDTQVEHAYDHIGAYSVKVTALSELYGEEVSYVFEEPLVTIPRDLYVSASSKNPVAPYASWATAAKKPNDAISEAVDGCIIHVRQGNYSMAGMTTRVNKSVVLQGEGEKPSDTSLNSYTSNSGSRNMEVSAPGALVCNLQLYGGFSGSAPGGGNLLLSAGVVSNCVLSSGRARNHPVSAGGAYVSGGLLTHCIITNSFQGNREQGIILKQVGGRVSNCLLTHNKFEWDSSRHATSLCYVDGGIIDNCTIKDCWIMYNTPDAQSANKYKTTDKAFNVTANGRSFNNVIANVRYCGWSIAANAVTAYDEKVPRRWDGTAASFVSCATDDATPINDTCFVGTLEKGSLFADYENKDLTPGAVTKNRGAASGDFAFPAGDLAGNPRVVGKAIDIGCYERQLAKGFGIIVR